MKRSLMMTIAVAGLALAVSTGFAAEQSKSSGDAAAAVEKAVLPAKQEPFLTVRVPLFSRSLSEVPLATVNGEVITLRALRGALEGAHGSQHAGKKQVAKVDYPLVLDRLINVKLIAQDAKTMGMADLPEIKAEMENFSKTALTEQLLEEVTKDVEAPDAEVEKLYKDNVREWKIKSVMFAKEDDAKKMAEELKAGKNFDEAVAAALDSKLAEGSKEGGFVKPNALQPNIADTVSKMSMGTVSSILEVDLSKNKTEKKTGYVILKLEDVRYPENASAKEQAKETVLASRRDAAVKKFGGDLIKKYVKINTKLIKSLDFESPKPGIENLLKDKRVIVSIKKGKPITVGDLAVALKEKYYHGIEGAIKEKKVNKSKLVVVGEMVETRLFRDEALRRGVDKSAEYKDKLREHEQSILFGTYINKVLIPDIKVSDEDLKAYYEAHREDYTYPEMMRVDSLVFSKLKDAESALTKLKQGADLKWMKSNTEGQVPKDTSGVLSFEGDMIMVTQMPKGVQKSLMGATAEDVRLYESPDGFFYVLYVKEVSPAKEEPLDTVRQAVSGKVYGEKLQKAVEDWAGKLRASGTVEVYLAPEKGADISNAK